MVARQPIFDRSIRVCAYELLFRSGAESSARTPSPDHATAEVGACAILDLGLDRLVGAREAWINIPRNVLVHGLYEFFPPERVVLELLETIEVDRDVLRAVERARSLGFRLALDDFTPEGSTRSLVPYADFIKLDVLALDAATLERTVKSLARPGLKFVAEKVESHQVFDRMRELGCDSFQGYFFARPQLVKGRRVQNNRLALLRVIGSLQEENASVETIEALIRSDMGLSYRVMRYVNSAAIGIAAPIESMRHAIMTLGMERVRACVLVLMLTAFDDKPGELVTTCLVRARYCQLLCQFHGLDPQKGFLVGLLSAIDAFLDRSMASVVAEMGLCDELARALIAHAGDLGDVLEAAIACESADWEQLGRSRFLTDTPRETYMAALSWSSEMQSSLG